MGTGPFPVPSGWRNTADVIRNIDRAEVVSMPIADVEGSTTRQPDKTERQKREAEAHPTVTKRSE